jgi:hypothetical protein
VGTTIGRGWAPVSVAALAAGVVLLTVSVLLALLGLVTLGQPAMLCPLVNDCTFPA